MHTIVAIATPRSPAVRGAVRISGDNVDEVLIASGIAPPDRTGRSEINFDAGLPIGVVPVDLLYWADNRSYTGNQSAEFHTIGSLPVLDAIVARLVDAGAIPAQPGEFTLRAFLAGRLDLTQAEAVLGVIDAPGGEAFEASLAQLAGNLSKPLQTIRLDLIQLLADIEAGLDFVDEDIEFVSLDEIVRRLELAATVIHAASSQLATRVQSTEVPSVTLRGLPNAGKSQLLNALANQQIAIVSATAGTTRDVVQQDVELGDMTVRFCDTAGIEDDGLRDVSASANAQSIQRDQTAQIRLWCVDASDESFESTSQAILKTADETSKPSTVDLFIATKSDIANRRPAEPWLRCSGKTGDGLNEVIQTILQTLGASIGDTTGTSIRCRESLANARQSIHSAIQAARDGIGQELVAAEIREALQNIGEVTGEIYTDDILDQVFSRFCIGK